MRLSPHPTSPLPTRASSRRLAALGTSLELKSRFGVGYTLTLSRAPPAAPAAPTAAAPSAGSRAAGAGNGDGSSESFERVAETALSAPGAAAAPGGAAAWGEDSPAVADIVALVREHVKDAQLLSASGGRTHAGHQAGLPFGSWAGHMNACCACAHDLRHEA